MRLVKFTALSLAVLALGVGSASADEATSLPTDHPIHFPMIESLEPVAKAYWSARGVTLPADPEVFLIGNMPGGVSGFGDNPGDRVWLTQWLLEERGEGARLLLCMVYLHERGHNAGLAHGSGDPIMEPNLIPAVGRIPPKCLKWAVSGFKVALARR